MGKLKSDTKVKNDWYTSSYLVEEIRTFLGSIDLDPASSPKANEIVKAANYFTIEDNALTKPWDAKNIFLNPPYLPSSLLLSFVEKAHSEHLYNRNVKQIVILTTNAVDTQWAYQLMLNGTVAFSQGRVSFINGETGEMQKSPGSGHMLTYFGSRIEEFTQWANSLTFPEGRGYPRGFYAPNDYL